MIFSTATANLYFYPFEQTLEIIAEAGFHNIELDLYWERKDWAMAQHLRELSVEDVVRFVDRSGLYVSSIHDGSGVLEDSLSPAGLVNPMLDRYLEALGYAPDCLVFHTPHVEGYPGCEWWELVKEKMAAALDKYRSACKYVTIENMPFFAGYTMPLTDPEALQAFLSQYDLYATLDTTHYAEIGVDIVDASRVLGSSLKTIHLSDYAPAQRHAMIGEGILDFSRFFSGVDRESLSAVTLECSFSSPIKQDREMNRAELVNRMKEARLRMEQYF